MALIFIVLYFALHCISHWNVKSTTSATSKGLLGVLQHFTTAWSSG